VKTAWREVERRYLSSAAALSHRKRKRHASASSPPASSSSTLVAPGTVPAPLLASSTSTGVEPSPVQSAAPIIPARVSSGMRRSRSELEGDENQSGSSSRGHPHHLPPPPSPPSYIPLPGPDTSNRDSSSYKVLERHRWRLAAVLISLGCAPADIKQWSVSTVGNRSSSSGGSAKASQLRYTSPHGGNVYTTLDEVKRGVLRAAESARSSGSVNSVEGNHSSDSSSGGPAAAAAAPAQIDQSTPKSKRVSTSAAGFAALAAAAAKAAALEGGSVNKVGTRRSNSETAGRWALRATNAMYAPQPASSSRANLGVSSAAATTHASVPANHETKESAAEEDTASAETDQVSSSDDESDDDDDDERNDARALAALRLAVLEARLKALSPNDGDSQSGDDEAGGGAAVGSSSSSSSGSGGSSSEGGGGGGAASPEHARYGSAGAGPVVSASDRKRLAELRSRGDGSLFAECVKIAKLLARSRHAVCYTGAGISTGEGANLPTIRGKLGISASQLKEEDFDPASISTLRPTRAHMALVALHASGVVRFVATQNIENLHRLSGLPDAALWEAHGNVCAATCPNCGKRFLRPPASKMCDAGCWDPEANAGAARRSWRTGMLKRNVLSHYGARVSKPAVALAHVDAADVSLIVGSSLSVQPFAKYAAQPRKLAIVNLERTKLHEAEERAKKHGARVLGEPCDLVLDAILLLLGVPYAWSSSSSSPGESRCSGDMPAVPANLPAFLEHGEDSLDVAAIFMGGRRAYNKPRSDDGQDGAGGGGGGRSARKPNRGRAPRVRLTAEVRRAGSDSGRSRRARWAALTGEGKEDEEMDALSSVDDNEDEEEEVEEVDGADDGGGDVGDSHQRSHSRRDLQRLEEFESSTEEEDDDVILIGDDDEVGDGEEGEEVEEVDDEQGNAEEEESEEKDVVWTRQYGRNRRQSRSSASQQGPSSGVAATTAEGRSRSSTRGMTTARGHSNSRHGELVSDTAQPAASVPSSSGGFVGFVKSVMPWG